jgi:hypothetical protein
MLSRTVTFYITFNKNPTFCHSGLQEESRNPGGRRRDNLYSKNIERAASSCLPALGGDSGYPPWADSGMTKNQLNNHQIFVKIKTFLFHC